MEPWWCLTGGTAATNVQAALAESDAEKVAKAGDTMSGKLTANAGISLGSGVAGTAVDVSRHIDLYGAAYGFTITSGTLNLVGAGVAGLSLTATAIKAPLPIISTYFQPIRFQQGNYSAFFHQDGGTFYTMLTNSGDPLGSYNGLRPFFIDLATGNVTMGQNVTINGTLAANGSIWTPNVYSSSTVQATAWMLSGSGSSGTYYFGNTGTHVPSDG